MTVLWIILGLPALVLLCWSDQLLNMALDAHISRRRDDKPARRRIVTPSNALPAGGERVSQPLSLFRRSRPIDSGSAAGDGGITAHRLSFPEIGPQSGVRRKG